jgi:hypothetical protein
MIISFYGHQARKIYKILKILFFQLSFVQIRGSIPIYWSQSGFKYRPPPVIDKALNESLPAFKQHFLNLEKTYGFPIVAINLVDTTGRESLLSDAFKQVCKQKIIDVKFHNSAHSSTGNGRSSLLSL